MTEILYGENIYALLGKASRMLKRAGRRDLIEKMNKEVHKCKSYDEAFSVIIKTLDEAGINPF